MLAQSNCSLKSAQVMFQNKIKLLVTAIFLSFWMSLGTSLAFAELADHEKPIELEADQVIVDDAQKISTFSGNVRLSQGSLLILGEKIIVRQDEGGFLRVTSQGKPSSFRQKREAMEGYVEGYGELVEYDARAKTIDLHTQARLKRDLDEVFGEHITYNANTEVFQVAGSPGTEDTRPKRVRAVLQPKGSPNNPQTSNNNTPPE